MLDDFDYIALDYDNEYEEPENWTLISALDKFYKAIENEFEENGTNAKTLWSLLYGEDTQSSSPRLLAIAMEGQLMGYVITFDFFQATYITCLQISEAHRGKGFGSLLLQYICKDPDRTYVLLSDVAMSDSEQLSDCVRKKMFYLKNGFRTVPVKWYSKYCYKYDVHVKGPDLELGSLLAVLRKGREIWNTACMHNLKTGKLYITSTNGLVTDVNAENIPDGD